MIPELVLTVISGIALFLSIVATGVSWWTRRFEEQRTVRDQLTTILDSISSNYLETARLMREAAQTDLNYYQNVSAILTQRLLFLGGQAAYLAGQLSPKLVTAVEFNTIALANASVGDLVEADNYHRKAVSAARSEFRRALAMRSYGIFMLSLGKVEEGREQHQKALQLLKGDNDSIYYQRGQTYQVWACHEPGDLASSVNVDDLFASARSEFSRIGNVPFRNSTLEGLELARSQRPSWGASFLGYDAGA